MYSSSWWTNGKMQPYYCQWHRRHTSLLLGFHYCKQFSLKLTVVEAVSFFSRWCRAGCCKKYHLSPLLPNCCNRDKKIAWHGTLSRRDISTLPLVSSPSNSAASPSSVWSRFFSCHAPYKCSCLIAITPFLA